MAEKVRFIDCSTDEFSAATKDDNALYFITSGDLNGSLYKGSLLIGKDFTVDLTKFSNDLAECSNGLIELVDIVEQLMNTSMNGLTWGSF